MRAISRIQCGVTWQRDPTGSAERVVTRRRYGRSGSRDPLPQSAARSLGRNSVIREACPADDPQRVGLGVEAHRHHRQSICCDPSAVDHSIMRPQICRPRIDDEADQLAELPVVARADAQPSERQTSRLGVNRREIPGLVHGRPLMRSKRIPAQVRNNARFSDTCERGVSHSRLSVSYPVLCTLSSLTLSN